MLPDIGFDVYPIFIVLGVFSSFVLLELYFRKKKIDKKITTSTELAVIMAAIVAIVTAILFQNLYDFIENPQNYKWTWGMTFFGGIIGGVLTFVLEYFVHLRKKYGSYLKHVAIVAGMAIPLAHAIGRIGCVLDGCCYGKETDSIFGIKFNTTETKVYPTNLFECIFLFVLAGLLIYLVFRHQFEMTLQVYMISYGVFRFLIEYLRGDDRGQLIPGVSPSQFWAILLFIGGLIYLGITLYLKHQKKNDPLKE